MKRLGNRLARAGELSFTKSDEEAGTRGPCQSAMHTARYDAVRLRRLRSFWPVMAD